jgi:hypothetical protein
MDDQSQTDRWAERHKLSQVHEKSARTQSIGYEQKKCQYCATCTMFEMIALLFIASNFSVNA